MTKNQKIGSQINKICIYGVGGVGGFFGGTMAHNLAKKMDKSLEIGFIARGEHLKKIKENGLILKTLQKEITVHPQYAGDDFKKLQSPDLILLCVKEYDLNKSVNEISQNIDENTIILPLLNGVDIYRRIREKISKGIILPACVYVGTHIEKPGVIVQSGGDGKIIVGDDPENPDFDMDILLDLFKYLKINNEYQADVFPAIWEKYIFITSFGLVSTAYDKTLGEIMENSELKDLVRDVMREILTLAELEGVKLHNNIITESLEKGNNFPYDTTTSYHKDVQLKGSKNEGDLFGGTVIRLSAQYGIKSPLSEKLYSIIQDRTH
ncbi:ketopantoate reductase family protein [Methanobacterium alcaliphilum]|uniref:ketopantoate reductase family protein n=1 Tax=Methanobacterium alcaliphilum TaxID=392018 RepID=UPI00200B3167|nr:2-dehydropantoate 2-reductase [Methanobacterium alcaliphilum]MCK9152102.1 2-dehydropantoate 2-reductase [Methanobacterium alcaliphilum]